MQEASAEEALLAVDLYNQPRQPRRLEAFLVHMHIAWLYLLQAEFKRDLVDYRYRLPNGRFERVDGEPKTWDLSKCVAERWPTPGPVRKNLELSIALRNKIEHRYHEVITLVTSGYAQSLLLNYEEELTCAFGETASLGEQLRFPIFVGSLTGLGQARFDELRGQLPKSTKDFLARFEADLDATIVNDQRYQFRVTLRPTTGPKSEADAAYTFVREADLTDEERASLAEEAKRGTVVVREQTRPVSGAGRVRPGQVAKLVEARIPFEFKLHHVVASWKALKCRPEHGAKHPERTDEKYCLYDEPHRDYVYTQAFVDKLAREASTAKRFRKLTGFDPVTKASS